MQEKKKTSQCLAVNSEKMCCGHKLEQTVSQVVIKSIRSVDAATVQVLPCELSQCGRAERPNLTLVFVFFLPEWLSPDENIHTLRYV